ncbi:multiple epidermal growth factor-like domains protein 9 [Silurus asotus]|uniref:Multiple epidermal growth factor-like domains protein 9 n=1 Tax=Silurus asotus TaxID=30991 RepID=A0AAD5FG03_SILAS|nr:multiple epidermal growth factor-like domains protein 9 [Silurus asotus]
MNWMEFVHALMHYPVIWELDFSILINDIPQCNHYGFANIDQQKNNRIRIIPKDLHWSIWMWIKTSVLDCFSGHCACMLWLFVATVQTYKWEIQHKCIGHQKLPECSMCCIRDLFDLINDRKYDKYCGALSVTAVQTAQWTLTAVTRSPAAVSVCVAIPDSIVSSVTPAISETTQVPASRVTVTHPEQRGCSAIAILWTESWTSCIDVIVSVLQKEDSYSDKVIKSTALIRGGSKGFELCLQDGILFIDVYTLSPFKIVPLTMKRAIVKIFNNDVRYLGRTAGMSVSLAFSGVCECKAGVDGDKCTNCRPGFFNFSSTGCQACQCNNHSNTCDKQSGVCLNCQGNTRGSSCAECKPNFYRERGSSLRFPCSTCPCSIVTSSGNCTLNAFGKPVCDQCNPEYEGPNCELCRDGFYNADSICVPCDCNGNAEPSSAPRTCNPETGHCLNCSFNTTGSHCQYCAPGFTGDALVKNCTAIIPTTPLYSSTMTTSPNVTGQFPTSSTALLSGLTSASANSTSNSELVSSWHQIRLIILAVIITLIVALLGTAGGIYTYRQYQNRKINAPFWTIELKEDNISFSSYHDSLTNADASGLLDDEACEAASNGQLTLNSPGSLYMP